MDQVLHRLEQQLARQSDAVALYRVNARGGAPRAITYKKLFAWMLAIREALRASCKSSNALLAVAIALPPCSIDETAVVLTVAQEKRWLYVPIDAALPLAQQVQMLKDARATVLVTLPTFPLAQFLDANADTLLDAPPQVVPATTTAAAANVFERVSVFRLRVSPPVDHQTLCDRPHAPAAALDASNDQSAHDPLYVLFTSGSTGRPKGVVGTRAGALQRLAWMWTQFPFAASERVVRVTKLTFVDSVWEILGALLQCVPLVHIHTSGAASKPRNSVVLDETELFVHAIATLSVSRLTIVPSVLEVLLRQYASAPLRTQLRDALASVRFVLVSGEVLLLSLVRDVVAALPHTRLLNLYGASLLQALVLLSSIAFANTLECLDVVDARCFEQEARK